MIEYEARKKWCPFARVKFLPEYVDGTEEIGPSFNRLILHDDTPEQVLIVEDGTACIGTKCMAWRWIATTGPEKRPLKKAGGYCGLAGRE